MGEPLSGQKPEGRGQRTEGPRESPPLPLSPSPPLHSPDFPSPIGPDRQLNVRLPLEIHRRLEAEARRQGRSRYALAREALIRFARTLPAELAPLWDEAEA